MAHSRALAKSRDWWHSVTTGNVKRTETRLTVVCERSDPQRRSALELEDFVLDVEDLVRLDQDFVREVLEDLV